MAVLLSDTVVSHSSYTMNQDQENPSDQAAYNQQTWFIFGLTNRIGIKQTTMSAEMQHDSIETAKRAIEQLGPCREVPQYKEVAQYIKQEFDRKHGHTWHCVAGASFGSYVTHETEHFIYYYIGYCCILLFKS
uniref:Dynein light chain n=1 Tax=Pristionchus pacificus TaxID=54126 RepID=A0A2A6BTD6_PRIPA|eukprot:PDM69076.1 hypothetical protein PRIPAC_47378 [Pristionchus pacificus]